MRINMWSRVLAVFMAVIMILGVTSVVLYETGVTTVMADALPINSKLADFLRKRGTTREEYEKYYDETFLTLTEEDDMVQNLVSKGMSETEARQLIAEYAATNQQINEYYTVDLSERQIQVSEYFAYAPETFSRIPFTEMDSVRTGAMGWSDALSLPLTAEYIAVKDKNGNVIVDLEPWMEHFIPDFQPNHQLSGEEQKVLLMGRIMTDPATGIAWLKALLRVTLISGSTLADLNPKLVKYRDEFDAHAYNDTEKQAIGDRGLEFCLRKNSAGNVVTSVEYRTAMTRVCILLNQLEFVSYTNDCPAEHYHLMYLATEDYARLPERIETGETYTWGVLRSKVRKDSLYDFTIWFNAGDARPGKPGTRTIPPTITPTPVTTSTPAQPTPTPGGTGDNPTPNTSKPTPDTNKPTPDTNKPTPDTNKPTPDTNPPTPDTNPPTPETNPTPEPTPTPHPEKDPDQDRVIDEQPGDQGTGQADTTQTEDSTPTQEPSQPSTPPRTDQQDQQAQQTTQETAPPADVNPTKDDCYVPGSETRDDLQPAPAAQTVSGGDREVQEEHYDGDQSTQSGQEGTDYEVPFLD